MPEPAELDRLGGWYGRPRRDGEADRDYHARLFRELREAPFEVPMALSPADCPAKWMRDRLPRHAVSIRDALPEFRREVLGWMSDLTVSIWFRPAIVWRAPGLGRDEWFMSTLGTPVDLRLYRWHVSHWMALPDGAA